MKDSSVLTERASLQNFKPHGVVSIKIQVKGFFSMDFVTKIIAVIHL